MEYYNQKSGLLSELCKAKNSWGILICFDTSIWDKKDFPLEELAESANWLKSYSAYEQVNLVIGDFVYIFSDREEVYDIFYRTIGDDGVYKPELNNYSGNLRHYCLIANPEGILITENT